MVVVRVHEEEGFASPTFRADMEVCIQLWSLPLLLVLAQVYCPKAPTSVEKLEQHSLGAARRNLNLRLTRPSTSIFEIWTRKVHENDCASLAGWSIRPAVICLLKAACNSLSHSL